HGEGPARLRSVAPGPVVPGRRRALAPLRRPRPSRDPGPAARPLAGGALDARQGARPRPRGRAREARAPTPGALQSARGAALPPHEAGGRGARVPEGVPPRVRELAECAAAARRAADRRRVTTRSPQTRKRTTPEMSERIVSVSAVPKTYGTGADAPP